jgi:hypothetical protein
MNRQDAKNEWEVIKAFGEGKKIQERDVYKKDVWYDFYGDALRISSRYYRVKPEKKIVDLSVLIESQIDCEFTQGEDGPTFYGPLKRIDTTAAWPYILNKSSQFIQCRPRMNHIHYWAGGECPLPGGVKYKTVLRGRDSPPNIQSWEHYYNHSDIIGFEVLELSEGYCWPWECDE